MRSFTFVLAFISLHPLFHSQRTNPTSLSGEQVCISSTSSRFITGSYQHSSFDVINNGAIYYNAETQYYLYPHVLAARSKRYFISNDPSQTTAISTCNLPIDKAFDVLNPDDCYTHWSPTDIVSVNCNDICISGSAHDFLDGSYQWIHFNTTTRSSVYRCKACVVTAYLFGYVYTDTGGDTHHNWRIGPNYPEPAAWSSCWINTNQTRYKFNLNDCVGWDDAIRFQWIDSNLTTHKCINDVLITTAPPVINPTISPGHAPTATPSIHPSIAPVASPTAAPSEMPSVFPSKIPTINPTDHPTKKPTGYPTAYPSNNPTQRPTARPTIEPTDRPSASPTNRPTIRFPISTRRPFSTAHPFHAPTVNPYTSPTVIPSRNPSIRPSVFPSANPSVRPTQNPSHRPSANPSKRPTVHPIPGVTDHPSDNPTIRPSYTPTVRPSNPPSTRPTNPPPTHVVTTHPFAFPTHKPTLTPSHIPTPPLIDRPDDEPSTRVTTEPIGFTTNLVIVTHAVFNPRWASFSVSNPDLSCGGEITSVKIMDRVAEQYDDEHTHGHWMSSSSTNNEWYNFEAPFNTSFILPISIQINKDDELGPETLESHDLIDSWEPFKSYDFGSNFCKSSEEGILLVTQGSTIDAAFHYFVISICILFILFGLVVFVDGKCSRRNDYFDTLLFTSSLIHVLCLMSYLFFVNDIFGHLHEDGTLVLVFGLSIVFIIIPIIISFGHLFKEKASPYWLFNDRIREWMSRYTELLYFYSVFTGSAFTACEIFNCNLFGLDLFFMGIPKQFLYKFRIKKVFGVCVCSTCPQMILIVYYSIVLGYATFIPLLAMIFSVMSIGCTLVALCMDRRIYDTHNHVYVTFDVTGPCMFDNKQLSTNRVRDIKSYLCRTVFKSIDGAAIQFMRPHYGMITNGLQIQIHIANPNEINCNKLEDALNSVIDMNALHTIVKKEWQLSSKPKIGNISCQFVTSNAVASRRERYGNEAVVTEEEDDDDEDYLSNDSNSTNSSQILGIWKAITNFEGMDGSEVTYTEPI